MDEDRELKRRGRQRYALMMLVSIAFLLTFISGCDKYSKQRVLTFFFTGVPPLESNEQQASVDSTVQGEAQRKVEVRTTWPSTHGPYGAGQCYLCHVMKGESKELFSGSFPSYQSLPKELLLPKNEVCIECHTTKSYTSAFTKNLWIHGPVSAGMCTTCHHHHHSSFSYLLLKKSSKELCSQCHIEESITKIEEHLEDKECTFCHNPHLGKNRFLLKKDFFEIF